MPDDDKQPEERKPGLEAKRLKFDMDREGAAKKIVGKEKPAEGWPEPSPATDEDKQERQPGR